MTRSSCRRRTRTSRTRRSTRTRSWSSTRATSFRAARVRASFVLDGTRLMKNVDDAVVRGFGDEWQRFDQRELSRAELEAMFDSYFSIFPWERLPADAEGFDAGCGSGRWASFVAPRVGRLHCIDASADALSVARRNLSA